MYVRNESEAISVVEQMDCVYAVIFVSMAAIDMQLSVGEMPLEGGMGFARPPHLEGYKRATGPKLKQAKR